MLAKEENSINMKKKSNEVTKGSLSPEQAVQSPVNEVQHVPLSINYGHGYVNPKNDQGDYKFIQSVNIINGYNVSLGDHNAHKAKH